MSNLKTFIADYTPKPHICQTFIAYKPLKNPIQNVRKCPVFVGKRYKRFG
jgi:hypothetical protein